MKLLRDYVTRRAFAAATARALSACGTQHAAATAVVAAAATATAAAAAASTEHISSSEAEPTAALEPRRLRVLITGFHDWRELEGNVWRCRDNPACQLLIGPEATQTPPLSRSGALVKALAATVSDVDFCYTTLPVTWNTAAGLDLNFYDVVIHLGLGVYDCHDKILLERGAYNFRSLSPDALAVSGGGAAISEGEAEEYYSTLGMEMRHEALARSPVALNRTETPTKTFKLETVRARPKNTYICNETHWRALKAVEAAEASSSDGGSRLRAGYFIHLPYASEATGGYPALGSAVAELIGRIVRLEQKRC